MIVKEPTLRRIALLFISLPLLQVIQVHISFSHDTKIMARIKFLIYYQGTCKNDLDGSIVIVTTEILAQNRTHN